MNLKRFKELIESAPYPYKIIPQILEELGILVVRLNIYEKHEALFKRIKQADEELTGALFYSKEDNKLYIFLHKDNMKEAESGYSLTFSERDNFTIMHELGHYFNEYNNVKLEDLNTGPLSYRDHQSTTGNNISEVQANEFAASNLIPDIKIRKHLSIFDKDLLDSVEDKGIISATAKRYGVSKSAMTNRLINLKLLKIDKA